MKLRRRIITIITVLSIVITIVNLAICFIFPYYLQYRMKEDIDIVSGMNIIGSADGPTSIILSGPSNTNILILFTLLSLCGIIYLAMTRRHKTSNER